MKIIDTKCKKILVGIIVFIIATVIIVVPTVYSYGYISSIHNLQKPKDGQYRIACIGDSITYGFGVSAWYMNNYPKKLGKELGDGFCVNNYGYSGRTCSFTGDEPYVEEKIYKKSLDFKPNLTIIMLGSNDSKPYNWKGIDSFKNDYKMIIQSYLDVGSKVILLTPPPVYLDGKFDIRADVVKNEVVPAVVQLSNELGVEYIDIYSALLDKEDCFTDGIHPDREGAALIASTVYAYLQEYVL